MARNTVLRMGAMNVVAHPHPEGTYERLIRFIHRRRVVGKIHSDRYGMITQVWKSPRPDIPGVHGVISTFVQFDAKQSWLDLATSEEASDEELNKIELPPNLRPGLKRCRFVLDTKTHTLAFDIEAAKGGVGPSSMLKFLNQLFTAPKVMQEFGSVSVSPVTEENSVDRVFHLSNISEIYIRSGRPNPGDFDTTPYEDLNRFLREQSADRLEQRIVSSDRTLTPNNATLALARVADENGYVEVKGANDEGQIVKRSTQDSRPLIETTSYNADVVDDVSAQYEGMSRIIQSVRRRRRRI